MKKTLEDFDFYDKRVLVRVDFNVPMKGSKIENDLRIVEALPTIKYLLNSNAKVILVSHLGRPDGKEDKKYSLKPIYEYLKTLLPNVKIGFDKEIVGENTTKKTLKMQKGEILLLENIRFLKGEEENDEELSKALSKLADIYVLDAFGTSHRKHSSTYGVTKFLPSCMGFLMQKEIEVFDELLNNYKRPLVAVLGGAKIQDKILVTENLLNKVDTLIIGGGMCFTFLKALGANVGASIVDSEKIDFAYDVIKTAIKNKVRLVLPVDFVCGKNLEDTSPKIFNAEDIPNDYMGLDIGPKTIKLFSKYLKRARTLVWNGPLGAYEFEQYSFGTEEVAKCIGKNKKCKSIVGGGDVVSAIESYNLKDKFYHVSTGGGASLKLLEGKSLVCYDALSDKE